MRNNDVADTVSTTYVTLLNRYRPQAPRYAVTVVIYYIFKEPNLPASYVDRRMVVNLFRILCGLGVPSPC